jgi:hypothetical protein
MKLKRVSVIFFTLLSVLIFFSSISVLNAQGAVFNNRKMGVGPLTNVYIEGYLIYNSQTNQISSNIRLKRGGKFGALINNARVSVSGTAIGVNRSGIFVGLTKMRGAISSRRVFGNSTNRNNLNLSISLGGRNVATVSDNITSSGSLQITPVYRIGLDVGEPITVIWTRQTRNRNSAELTIVNAANGNLILRRVMRSNRYIIRPRTIPPRKTVIFRVKMFEKRLNLRGNIAPGSTLNLYSGGEFRFNTHG